MKRILHFETCWHHLIDIISYLCSIQKIEHIASHVGYHCCYANEMMWHCFSHRILIQSICQNMQGSPYNHIPVLNPRKHPLCHATWTLWRAVLAHGTLALSLVLLRPSVGQRHPFWPSWLDNEHRGEQREGFIEHNALLESWGRLWHLLEKL